MTALGLAVAIPAVLAYNAFVRSNRLVLAKLDAFAHDLFAVLTTGSRVSTTGEVLPLKVAARRREPEHVLRRIRPAARTRR